MNCLLNYIPVRGCVNNTPDSGLWLNDLPGMSNELLQSISSPDQLSYIETFASIQRVAYERFKSDLYSMLFSDGDIELNSTLVKSKNLQVLNRQTVIPRPASEQLRGAYVTVAGSKYLSVYCESLQVWSGNPEETEATLKVIQTQDGQVLYQQEITLLNGMNTITVNKEFFLQFDCLNLFFAVDCSNIETMQNSFITGDSWGYWADPCSAIAMIPFWQNNGWMLWPATSGLDYQLGRPDTSARQTGVWPLLEVRCSLDALICRYKNRLKMAWGNLLAAQTLETKQNTKQQNFFAVSAKEQTEKSRVEFLEKYAAEMSAFARSINLRNEGFCFNCHQSILVKSSGMRA